MIRRQDPVEQQIQEAIKRGEFDNLPGAGKPLDTGDSGPGWWTRRYLDRLRAIDRSGEISSQVDQELGRVWILPDEAAVRDRVTELNTRLAEANQDLAIEDRIDLLNPDQVFATWWKMARARRS